MWTNRVQSYRARFTLARGQSKQETFDREPRALVKREALYSVDCVDCSQLAVAATTSYRPWKKVVLHAKAY